MLAYMTIDQHRLVENATGKRSPILHFLLVPESSLEVGDALFIGLRQICRTSRNCILGNSWATSREKSATEDLTGRRRFAASSVRFRSGITDALSVDPVDRYVYAFLVQCGLSWNEEGYLREMYVLEAGFQVKLILCAPLKGAPFPLLLIL